MTINDSVDDSVAHGYTRPGMGATSAAKVMPSMSIARAAAEWSLRSLINGSQST